MNIYGIDIIVVFPDSGFHRYRKSNGIFPDVNLYLPVKNPLIF